jgi:hypothetical protein
MIACDPNIARILNAPSRQFELEQFARLELNRGGREWVSAFANGSSRRRRTRRSRLYAGFAAFLTIFR